MSDENKNSQFFNINQNTCFETPVRPKVTAQSVYLRVDDIQGEWGVKVMSNGENLSYDQGYVNGFLIRNPGRYALMNYVNETGHKDCYLSLKPLHGTQHINFCWSPGSQQSYTHPEIWKGDRIITGIATAYCDGGLAADGTPTGPGCIAVNPRRIPYGTHLHVTWDGGSYDGVAHDTGGACMSGAIVVDLWFPTEAECNRFGRRNVKVYY